MNEWMNERNKERRRKKNKIEIFTFAFLHSEEKECNSVAIFYIRIAKGFDL